MRSFLLLLLIFPLAAQCQIYRHVAPDGTIHYSDKPSSDSKAIKLRPLQSYKPQATPQENKTATPDAVKYEASHNYNHLSITSPAPNESIWNGIGLVDVIVDINPSLAEGDKLVFIFDDRIIGESRSDTRFTLNNVVRGAHRLQVKIVDRAGQTIKETEKRIFYMHRPRVNMSSLPAAKVINKKAQQRPPSIPIPLQPIVDDKEGK